MEEQKKELGMKWFKFLIYFALWAGAVLNVANGVQALTGIQYNSNNVTAEMVYSRFPTLKGVDVFYGVACMLIAVLQISVRFALAKFKTYGPLMLYLLDVIIIIIGLIYIIAVSTIVPGLSVASTLAPIIVSVVRLIIDVIYFKKRKDLFKN
jgi:hypothetical protein